MSIHENIRAYRKQNHLTQEELAEAMAVSCAAVSKWENGQCAPDLSTLTALADFFQVSVDTLLDHRLKADRLEELLVSAEQAADEGETEKAGELCETLLRNYPNSPEAVDCCAGVYYQLFIRNGEAAWMEKCIAQTKRLFILKKGEPEADRLDRFSSLANQYELLGQWEQAKEYYEKGSVGGSEDAHIALCLLNLGRHQEALTLMSETIVNRVFTLEQNVGTLSDIWSAMGQEQRACEALEWVCGALEQMKYSPVIIQMFLMRIALLRSKLGDRVEAEEAIQKAEQFTVGPEDLRGIQPDVSFLRMGKPRKLLLSSNYQDAIASIAASIRKQE